MNFLSVVSVYSRSRASISKHICSNDERGDGKSNQCTRWKLAYPNLKALLKRPLDRALREFFFPSWCNLLWMLDAHSFIYTSRKKTACVIALVTYDVQFITSFSYFHASLKYDIAKIFMVIKEGKAREENNWVLLSFVYKNVLLRHGSSISRPSFSWSKINFLKHLFVFYLWFLFALFSPLFVPRNELFMWISCTAYFFHLTPQKRHSTRDCDMSRND